MAEFLIRKAREEDIDAVEALYEKIHDAEENGCAELRMDTNEKNKTARAMYKKSGYEEVGILPTEFNGIPNVNLVLLEKSLK